MEETKPKKIVRQKLPSIKEDAYIKIIKLLKTENEKLSNDNPSHKATQDEIDEMKFLTAIINNKYIK